jgi:crotonobetainyl-CoA:carnitine CoA-transferase CaiB-like acyl-CoA transferase
MAVDGLYRPRDDEPGPLAGVRVVDLTIARAGPTCVRQLADLGADVVQVVGPARADLGGSDAFNLHRGKRSIIIDLKHPDGLEVFCLLVDRADVLVENFRADVKRRLGIGYELMSQRNPRLVYASISGFGQSGPYAERPGLDQIAQGMGGLMSVTGPPDSGPWRAGIAISDTASGTFLTQGVLASLYARERTGRGQWVHTSLLESMINFMDFQATRWLIDGVVPGQTGNDHPTLFPMGTFETLDGRVNIAVLSGWDRFLTAIDAEELASDPRFGDFVGRLRNREALRTLVGAKLRRRTSAEWIEVLARADIPCGPILALDEVFADPQVQALELTRSVEHEQAGGIDVLRHPVTFSDTPAGVREAPPIAGRHTREVLGELGCAAARIDELIAAGAVGVARET